MRNEGALAGTLHHSTSDGTQVPVQHAAPSTSRTPTGHPSESVSWHQFQQPATGDPLSAPSTTPTGSSAFAAGSSSGDSSSLADVAVPPRSVPTTPPLAGATPDPFERSPESPSPASDPLSHLLRDGARMSPDQEDMRAAHEGAARSSNHHSALVRTQQPLAQAGVTFKSPTGWGSSSIGGVDGDQSRLRDRVSEL